MLKSDNDFLSTLDNNGKDAYMALKDKMVSSLLTVIIIITLFIITIKGFYITKAYD